MCIYIYIIYHISSYHELSIYVGSASLVGLPIQAMWRALSRCFPPAPWPIWTSPGVDLRPLCTACSSWAEHPGPGRVFGVKKGKPGEKCVEKAIDNWENEEMK